MFGQLNQRRAIWACVMARADERDEGDADEERGSSHSTAEVTGRPRRLEDQPGCAEQGIAGDKAKAADDGDRAGELERAAGEGAVANRNAVDEGAEDDPVTKSRQHRAPAERSVPDIAKPPRPKPELECKTAEDQKAGSKVA
jgi:hypothetical protein